ncbi:MAG: hypothetical protein AAB434_09150 [Planctomycetota bacterium]
MIAWLQGGTGAETRGFLERVAEEFEGFFGSSQATLVSLIALCGVVLIVMGIKRALAPRARRTREIAELFERLVGANGLSAEERRRIEEAVKTTNLENPAQLFARPTVYEAATRAVLAARPAEKERLAAQYEALRTKLFS